MKLMAILLCFLLSLNIQKDNKTELFNQYLKQKHKITIPQKKHFFIIVNFNQCLGCLQNSINFINSIEASNDITIITCYKSKKKPKEINLIKTDNVLDDKGALFFSFNISPLSDVVIVTANKKIEELLDLDESNLSYFEYRLPYEKYRKK